jgi:hypothetical protein
MQEDVDGCLADDAKSSRLYNAYLLPLPKSF